MLRIAAVQFPVSSDITKNSEYICRQIKKAAARGAQMVQFPETALSGYAPKHVPSLANYPWTVLDRSTHQICHLAAASGVWVVLGAMRRIDGGLPRSSLFVISDQGEIVGTYDKRRLYGKEHEFFSTGTTPCVVEINNVRCGFLICYDNCFPELYDEYRDLGVELLFHSFYNAGNRAMTTIADLMQANLIVRAADNRMWIAASNSSERFSPLAASIVRPDGSMVRARRHVTGFAMDTYPDHHLGWTYDNRAICTSL